MQISIVFCSVRLCSLKWGLYCKDCIYFCFDGKKKLQKKQIILFQFECVNFSAAKHKLLKKKKKKMLF